jgi:energy-coupling factor transporter ATP-binding protein EcfA2
MTQDEMIELTFEAKEKLRYEQPLDLDKASDRSLLVELNDARGEFSQDKLLFELGVVGIDSTPRLYGIKDDKYLLFGGHRGCGKSTELRRLAKKLHRPELYYVVFVDALTELDINNLRYCDILLAQAKVLMEQLQRDKIQVEPVFLTRMENWFTQRVKTRLSEQQFSTKVEAGVELKAGLPFVGNLFAKLTNAISFGSTHKDEIREIVRNSYGEFSDAFNSFIQHVNEQLNAANKAKK